MILKKCSLGSIVIWSIIPNRAARYCWLTVNSTYEMILPIIHSSFSSLQQTSIQVTAELIREKLSLWFLKHLSSPSPCHLYLFLPPIWNDTAVPPTSSFHPRLFFRPPLVFRPRPSGIYLPLPPAHLLSPPLTFKDDTSRAERGEKKTSAPFLSVLTSVIKFSSRVSPRSLTSGFYLTPRHSMPEQREPHNAKSLPSLPGAPYRNILPSLYFLLQKYRHVVSEQPVRLWGFPAKRNTTSFKSLSLFSCLLAAHQQRRLHCSSGDWWDCSSGTVALIQRPSRQWNNTYSFMRFPFGSSGSIFFSSAFIILCDLTQQPRQSGTAHTLLPRIWCFLSFIPRLFARSQDRRAVTQPRRQVNKCCKACWGDASSIRKYVQERGMATERMKRVVPFVCSVHRC